MEFTFGLSQQSGVEQSEYGFEPNCPWNISNLFWVLNGTPRKYSFVTWFAALLNYQCAPQQSQAMLGAWETVGEEAIICGKQFLTSAFLPATANSTILSLVPKFPGASRISDFRPISCLNTVYKVISCLLVARLKPILQHLVLPCQTSFVKDRLLVENTILASELIHGYHKNKGPKKITIKVDIAKTFDTLSWEFLFSCLEGLNLPRHFLSLLKACVCKTSFMIGYNGTVTGYFKGKRGLRQGDPLSPYLFVIGINCLSFMLNEAASQGRSLESVQTVLQVLHEVEKRSGIAVSYQKTSFYAPGMSAQEIDTIQASTGMTCDTLPVHYLGVPLNSRKLNLTNFEPLIHQIKKRLSSWSVKSLSFSGRLLLIKTVISGITTFWCSAFILPKACIKRINSLCSVFLWKGDIESHNSKRVAWDTVTLTKSQGGLGIKDLNTWNTACCLKLIWMLFFRAGSGWVAWFKEVVLEGSIHNYWTTKPSTSFSWLANKLLKLKTIVYPLIKLRLQNGTSARFWTDNWTPFGSLTTFLNNSSSRLGIPAVATVASLSRNGMWQLPSARTEQQRHLLIYLTTFTLNQEQDYYDWELAGKTFSKYSTRDVYTYLRGEIAEVNWSKSIWSSYEIPRYSFLAWLVINNRCPTRDRLIGWGIHAGIRSSSPGEPTRVTAVLAGEHNHATVQLAGKITGAMAELAGRVQPHDGSARRASATTRRFSSPAS
ncbi:uncharacterized protein LOC125592699 [Brassica napus]|uniref:uncharacterized protein LOC125592699 n=1 Tax=Brassica napus TaxID=3708 RepID=UPI00207B00AB|nr:uncharacterized protein LOC125592699 [Brassica napus]